MSLFACEIFVSTLLKADVLGWKREVDGSDEAVEHNWKT